LIVIAARGLVAKPRLKRTAPQGLATLAKGQGKASFRLFDPRKRFFRRKRAAFGPKLEPRIHVFGFGGGPLVPILQLSPQRPLRPTPGPDSRVSALPLYRRLNALKVALADVPAQARRLVRWQARRESAPQAKFTTPLRPGRPPGYRRTPTHGVDHVLAECHGLAYDAMRPNTS
jgi:hypothetical protein